MKIETLFRRLGVTLAMIVVAGSVAALDVQCCGNGGDDPEPPFDGPNDFAPPPANEGGGGGGSASDSDEDGDGPAPGTWTNGAGNAVDPVLLAQCEASGGVNVIGTFCYDQDGNYVQM